MKGFAWWRACRGSTRMKDVTERGAVGPMSVAQGASGWRRSEPAKRTPRQGSRYNPRAEDLNEGQELVAHGIVRTISKAVVISFIRPPGVDIWR
jgi:hypothetical protein